MTKEGSDLVLVEIKIQTLDSLFPIRKSLGEVPNAHSDR